MLPLSFGRDDLPITHLCFISDYIGCAHDSDSMLGSYEMLSPPFEISLTAKLTAKTIDGERKRAIFVDSNEEFEHGRDGY